MFGRVKHSETLLIILINFRRDRNRVFFLVIAAALPCRNKFLVLMIVSGGFKNFEKEAEDNLSVPSSFIANADNELYAFYTEKGGFKKISESIGGGATAPTAPP